jgi:ribose-phosphate pyrophosphokinase
VLRVAGCRRRRARARLRKAPQGADLAIIDKRRAKANVSEVMHIIGDVEGRDCVIIDDMIDTAGTLTNARAGAQGSTAPSACSRSPRTPCSRGPAVERIRRAPPRRGGRDRHDPALGGHRQGSKKFTVLSVARLLGEAIKRIHNSDSVSSLFV